MWKKLFLISISVWILSVGLLGYFFVKGNTKKDDDGRMAVKLQKEERNIVLSEMRQLLSAVQGILESITLNDMKRIEQISHSVGMNAAADVNPRLMAKLPLDFKSTGMGVHKRFDELAKMANAGAKKELVLSEVSDIMKTCVACHQAFRLDEVE